MATVFSEVDKGRRTTSAQTQKRLETPPLTAPEVAYQPYEWQVSGFYQKTAHLARKTPRLELTHLVSFRQA